MAILTVCVIVLFAICMFALGWWTIKAALWTLAALWRALARRGHYTLTDEGPTDPLKRKDTWR